MKQKVENRIDEVDVEPEDYTPIKRPFDPKLINIGTDSQSISNIMAKVKEDEIDLSPAFQRHGNLWDKGRQSRLIESLLLRIPLPAFYFDMQTVEVPEDYGIQCYKWQVIDGLQRLSALRNFIVADENDQNFLRLQNLEFLSDLEGKSFAELPRPYQRIINETNLTLYLIQPATPPNVKFNIFKRVNTGGIPLTQQEIRHALNQGVAADFLMELAESDHFTDATNKKISPRRMLDREFVNRFLAFFALGWEAYQELDSFLDEALKCIAKKTQAERDEIRDVFYDSLDAIRAQFKRYAFCKLDAYPKAKPINRVLFEVLTVSVARLSAERRERFKNNVNAFDSYRELFGANRPLTELVSTSTADKNRIRQRYEILERYLNEMTEG